MSHLTLEAVEPAGFLCHPVPGSKFQTYHLTLSIMPRNDLLVNYRKALTWLPGTNKLADAVIAEWNGRYAHWAALANAAAREKTIAKFNAELEFRTEVMDAICATGITRHVAADMTNTERKLLDTARKYGIL